MGTIHSKVVSEMGGFVGNILYVAMCNTLACMWEGVGEVDSFTVHYMYASSTVHVAMSAIIGWHALNDLQNPIRLSPRLSRLWTAVRRVNGLGVRKKKALCDHAFVASMYALY